MYTRDFTVRGAHEQDTKFIILCICHCLVSIHIKDVDVYLSICLMVWVRIYLQTQRCICIPVVCICIWHVYAHESTWKLSVGAKKVVWVVTKGVFCRTFLWGLQKFSRTSDIAHTCRWMAGFWEFLPRGMGLNRWKRGGIRWWEEERRWLRQGWQLDMYREYEFIFLYLLGCM